MCPVSGLDASGFIQVMLLLLLLLLLEFTAAAPAPSDASAQFVGLWTCGHMMSKKALDATADEPDASAAVATTSTAAADSADQGEATLLGGGSCPVCSAVISAADVIPILPSEADRETRRR